jgi:hypothetical protein
MSIVRENLLSRPGYTPYCGSENCVLRMPRTFFDGEQFKCRCGWRSRFEAEFIGQYKAFAASHAPQVLRSDSSRNNI